VNINQAQQSTKARFRPTILRFESLDSTNTEAARQARRGAPEGLCIVAREQTAGRGRQQRVWISPAGAGLYCSTLLRPRLEMSAWPLITLAAALAVHDALIDACALTTDIKWPNDICARERKLCGILAETVETESGRACVLGIGINLRESVFPAELREAATSIEALTGQNADAETLLEALLRSLALRYETLQGTDGQALTLSAWTARSSYAEGRRVKVTLAGESFEGTTRGLEHDGALRVETNGEIRIIRAGDITIRGMKEKKNTKTAKGSSSSQRLNYYNYFTEIEETFTRRRGKHLLLSPVDWALIESWKEMGVPLHVVVNGIEHAFDSYDARPRKRSVKTLMYCQEEVEAQYAEWLESQLGAQGEPEDGAQSPGEDSFKEAHLPFPRAAILEHMARARQTLMQIAAERKRSNRDDELSVALARVCARLSELEENFAKAARPRAEKLEESLTSLEKMLDDALGACVSAALMAAARKDVEAQLNPYRNRMEQSTYEQTFANLFLKRLRDQYGIPRLSLFYL
jgi:BirA family transcriptional regulator, biotin operon repressor / biotin---[acetyl-CoA-carboxylase] ligase